MFRHLINLILVTLMLGLFTNVVLGNENNIKNIYDNYVISYDEFKIALENSNDNDQIQNAALKYNDALLNYKKILSTGEITYDYENKLQVKNYNINDTIENMIKTNNNTLINEAKEIISKNETNKLKTVIHNLNNIIQSNENDVVKTDAKILLAKIEATYNKDYKKAANLLNEVLNSRSISNEQLIEANKTLIEISEMQFREKTNKIINNQKQTIVDNKIKYAKSPSVLPLSISKLKAYINYCLSCIKLNNEINSLSKLEPKLKPNEKIINKNIEESKRNNEVYEYMLYQPQEVRPLILPHPRVISKGRSDKKWVSLTFDDGPHPKLTPELLNILKKNNIKATFFVLGNAVKTHPLIVKNAYLDKHTIGNHSMTHLQYSIITPEGLTKELNGCNEAIKMATNISKVKYYRPPYGSLSQPFKDKANLEDFYIILWSVDSLDWKRYAPEYTMSKVLKELHNGAILLFHDIHPTTIELMKTLIPRIKDLGYKFVDLDTLLNLGDGIQKEDNENISNQSNNKPNAIVNWPGSTLNVRSAPWGKIIGELPHNTKIIVVDKENEWYKIKYKDGFGYVHSKYVVML